MKFSELQLHPVLRQNLERIQFVDCTPIQEQAIPLLRQGKDLSGLAQTGTGKTGAFLIPLIDRLLKGMKPEAEIADTPTVPFPEWKRRQYVLVLVPTRELCDQVWENAKTFLENTGMSSVAIYGGTTYEKQIAALKQGVEFVIATPGRFIDLYKEHLADLGLVRAVIFDEADRMFNMGFRDDMKFILKRIPRDRQFMVFSATLNFEVLNVAYEYGADPVEINISRDQAKAENVKDSILHVGQTDKPRFLLSLLRKHNPKQAIIFSNYKHNVERIARFLNLNGVPAMGISSLLTQAQRNRVMEQFKAENEKNILVATDVAARGLDILGVDLVVNFDLPEDAENYVHRIGRTGRAGATGQAFSMVGDRDVDSLQRIEDYLGNKVEAIWIDDAELAKDFKPFPPDESRSRGPHRGGAGGGRFEKRDRPPRPAGGPGRDRDRGPRPNGPPRAAATGSGEPQNRQARPPGQRSSGTAQGPSEQGPRHRDRNSGRHRDQQGPRQAQGGPQGTGGPNRDHSRGPRPQSQGGRPQQGRHDQARRHPQHGRGARPQHGGGGARTHAKMAAAPSLGQKVGGFLKKLFGGKES